MRHVSRPRLRPGRVGAVTLFVLAVLAPAVGLADLDVAVPPGLPFEWEQPGRRPTQSLQTPQQPDDPGPEPGETRTRHRAEYSSRLRPGVDVEQVDAMSYARITTVDILGHLGWSEGPDPEQVELPKEPRRGRRRTGDGGGGRFGEPVTVPYPPEVSVDVYWLVFGMVLRKQIHPNRISEFQSVERLVEIGYPALGCLTALGQVGGVGGRPPIAAWTQAVGKRVGPMPARMPRAVADPDPHRAMLLRVVADDLAGGFPHSITEPFATRVLSLPSDEAVALLTPYAEEGVHPLLRRNAVALLGLYRSPDVTRALEAVVEAEDDDVAGLRAYLALARQGSPEAEAAAREEADNVPALTIIHVLGLLRSPEGLDHALRLLRSDDPHDLLVALPAIGRVGSADRKAIRRLTRLVKALAKGPEDRWFEPAVMPSDMDPDGPSDKRDLVIQMALITLARLGDDWGRQQVMRLLDESEEEDPNAGRIFRRPAPIASEGTFGVFTVAALAYLVESLEHMGPEGLDRLRTVAEDTVCDVGLRMAALRGLERQGAQTENLIRALLDDGSGAVAAYALKRLVDYDRLGAVQRARSALASGDGPERIAAAEVVALEGREYGLEATPGAEADLLAAPGTDADVVTGLAGQASVTVLERRGDWLRVRTADDQEGWVARDDVTITASTSDEALATALGQVSAPDGGAPTGGFAGNPTLTSPLPVGEAIAQSLGGFGSEEAVAALAAFLGDAGQAASARGAAAVALGVTGAEPALEALAAALDDGDGWVRYSAYRGLRHAAGEAGPDHFADWVYGEAADRAEATRAWRAWVADR